MKNSIEFEKGDIAHCPYYDFTGEVQGFSEMDGVEYIKLKNGKGETCSTNLCIVSANNPIPSYIQMVCKKSDVDHVINKLFGM
jgi:hypothetical protein